MEFTLPTLTLSALLASFSGNGLSSGPVITTHTKSVISGQWQILLDQDKPTSLRLQENTLLTTATPKEQKKYLKEMFAHNDRVIKAIYKNTTDHYSLPAIVTIEEGRIEDEQTDGKASLGTNKGTECRELYNFDQDNQVRVSSGAEVTLGKYALSHQEVGLPIIVMTTTDDNNEIDCSGFQLDQTGESMIAYLKYMNNTMSWCSDAQGKDCTVHFNRVYP